TVAVIPGSGTFGMEAVARQFATNKKCLVIRNGWFSYRWSQIFEMGSIPADTKVLSASATHTGHQAPFAPPPIEEVVAAIREYQPDLVFAPHVETASGILLPDEYLAKLAAAVHEVGGLFVLDCIASGTIWVDMQCLGIDVVISAPQKGWTGSACCALVMLSARAAERLRTTRSTSFACDLAKWVQIMHSYEEGGHAYHATLPTDSLVVLRDAMLETERYGFEQAKADQYALGQAVRDLLAEKGFNSVAAPGFQAPGVVVSYTEDSGLQSAEKFADVGVQAAAGVPLKCDEPPSFKTFRLGLFGLDKLQHRERTVTYLKDALDQLR
ncbi:MAG TPA: aminotransferase class V-fold PLP-dependent enzyme, partial [Candidatus Paenalcaligenes intestinipullorum]|nr:aminotransferase class V-fold PLP-dependent enzyme [Candidatus Paenalcaligenes intestinipullorum]